MIIAFYIFAALLIYFSFRSFRGGIDYLKYFEAELAKPLSDYSPFATIIAPCKGLDEGLETNLTALLELDYPRYEVIFVVDDESDPAVSIIQSILNRRDAETRREEQADEKRSESSASPRLCGGKLVIAAKATESSQKVENLRGAVLHADGGSKIFAFVDSDARPAKDWLRLLVEPLVDESVGAATGYRWFISRNPTFASELRSAWNASIASALGPNAKSNFCWGGSMAIRRDTFEQLDIRDKWLGTLSDDFTVTRVMNAAGKAIHFVPQALTPSIENCSFSELLEFTTRQMKITRVCAPHLWLMSFFGSGLFCSVMISAFLIVILSRQNTIAVWAAIVTILLVSVFSIAKAWLRLKAVRVVMKQHQNAIDRQILPQITLWLITPPLFFYNCVCALFSRRMTWRGIRYELVSPDETRLAAPTKR